MSLHREIEFQPAFDKRNPAPSKNYGIHGVNMRCYLKGPLGAVQFVLYTNWHLPHVQEELDAKDQTSRFNENPHLLCHPLPADLGYHSPKPQYEGQSEYDCDLLPGGKCYYDGSGLNAERIYQALVAGGSDAMWKELEDYYADLFIKDSVSA